MRQCETALREPTVLSFSQALYVVDAQISEAAITAIGAWATAGGQVRCHFMLKSSLYRDRLGTNIGRTQKETGLMLLFLS